MPFQIVRNDITKVAADAIVNTANPLPLYAAGTDAAIYQAAGADELLAERRKIGMIARGEVAVTGAFALPAKYIIHTVGPVWSDGASGELDTLASCYRKSLEKAAELKCESIAFPMIATGVYGFPKDKALQVALQTISSFLMNHEMDVILVVFDRRSFELSGRVFEDVAQLIDDEEEQEIRRAEYSGFPGASSFSARRMRALREERAAMERLREAYRDVDMEAFLRHDTLVPEPVASAPTVCEPVVDIFGSGGAALEDLLAKESESFQQCLFRMIDARKLKDADVYTRANIDRKHFSKIRCNADYHPKKSTVLALAVALELSMDETVELLSKAGLALTNSSKFDIIVSYFISNRQYNIITDINPILFKYDQPLLGA